MGTTIDYYYALISPWSFFGHRRITAMAEKHGARLVHKPFRIMDVFEASGGQPLAKRAPARQAWRLVELERFRKRYGIALNLKPKFFPADETQAAHMVLAHAAAGGDPGALVEGIMRAVWCEDRNIADRETLTVIARECGLDGAALLKAGEAPAIEAERVAHTQEAIARGVFGAPTYFLGKEMFFGQDRLDFLEEALARG